MSTTRAAPPVLSPDRPEPTGAPSGTPPRQPSAWRNRLHRFDMKYVPYLLISPFFILFAIFGLFPIVFNGIVALRHWRLDDPTRNGWAGLENFSRLLGDEDFLNALYNTFGIFVLSTVPQLLLALVIANVLNRRLRGQLFYRVGVLLPFITPVAATALVFNMVFAKEVGMANWVLSLVGIGEPSPIDWRASKWASWTAIATMVNWQWIGYNALLYLGAMQTVPRDLYEAAAIDGAGPWRQLWRITVPMIRPVVIFTVVIGSIYGLQIFTQPMFFELNAQAATGGADGEWQTVAQLIYRVGWKNLNLGYAAAMSWALFLIIVVVAAVNAVITNRLGGGKK